MTTVQQIRKRDGRVVPFHENKIADAINKAFQATYKPGYDDTAAKLAHEVASVLEVEGGPCPDVEHIQDVVERVLMDNGYVQTAKAYILYRAERSRVREMNTRLMKIYEDITFTTAEDSDIKRENANIDGDTAMGTMLKYGCEGAKQFYQMFVLNPEHARSPSRTATSTSTTWISCTLTTTCCPDRPDQALRRAAFPPATASLREPNDIASLFRSGLHRHPVQPERPARRPEHRQLRLLPWPTAWRKTYRKRSTGTTWPRRCDAAGGPGRPRRRSRPMSGSWKQTPACTPRWSDMPGYLDAELPLLLEHCGQDDAEMRKSSRLCSHHQAVKETDRGHLPGHGGA